MAEHEPSRVARLIAEGDERLTAGDVDGAEAAYRRAWEADSSSADAAWSLGCVASHRNDLEGSLAWAERALELDCNHVGGQSLAGNALLGLERPREAIEHLSVVAAAGSELAMAQIALCLEALGRLPEAEAKLRTLLERDPGYQTRQAAVAMYYHSPFWADAHHALARVLQGLGALEEARLHYHLAMRIDPETILDPRYLEIMSTEDLEDHPIDRIESEPEFSEDADEAAHEIVRLTRLDDYDALVAAVMATDREALVPRLAGLIEASQVTGKLTMSARLRMLIDVAAGADARELFDALATSPWRRLLDVADNVATGRIPAADAADAARAEGPPPFVPSLLRLAGRFAELEPNSGIVVAELVAAAVDAARPAELAEALRHVAQAQLRCGNTLDAEASLRRALKASDAVGDDDAALEVLGDLWRVQSQRDDPAAAEPALRRRIDLLARMGDRDGELRDRANLTVLLYRMGREREAHDVALAVAGAAVTGEGDEELAEHVAALIEATAAAIHERLPDDLIAALRQRSGGDAGAAPLAELRDAGLRAAGEGRLDEALRMLERSRDLADATGTRRDRALALLDIGQTLAMTYRDADARTELEKGLRRAEPEGGVVDVWPALMALSTVCDRLQDHASAVEAAERALALAERSGGAERVAASHGWLSRLLLDTEPGRAVHHYGRSLRSAGGLRDEPPAWTDATLAFSQRNYAAALEGFEAVAAQEGPNRAGALSNSARARVGLGDLAGAEAAFGRSHDAFTTDGNGAGALNALADVAAVRRSRGLSTDVTMARMRAELVELAAPHQRRAGGLVVGAAALEAYDNELAEAALRGTLDIATSSEWGDIDDEIAARRLLGTLYRRVGRNVEAEAQYRTAIASATEVRDERAEGDLRGRLGIALRQLGQLEEALAEYDRAIAIAVLHGAADEVAVHKMNRASVLFELGRDEAARAGALEAWRAFEEQGQSELARRTLLLLDQNVARADLPPEALARLDELLAGEVDADAAPVVLSRRAVARLRAGDEAEARADLTDALETIRARGDRVEEVRALLNRARVLGEVDADAALADVRDATALARKLDNAELEVDAVEVRVGLALAWGTHADVFSALRELDRGLTFLRRRLSRDRDRVALAGRAAERFKDYAAALAESGQGEAAIAVLELARARALDDLLSATTGEAGEAWPDPLDLDPARAALAALGPGAVAVALDLVGGGVAVTVVPADGPPSLRASELEDRDVERLMAAFRHEVISFRGRAAQTWARQAAPLLACIAEELEAATTVVLLPDGPLHELPLHAVPMPDGRTLLEHARVVYAPSLHAFVHLHRRQGLPADDPLATIATVGVAFPNEARAVALRIGGPCLSGRRLDKELVHDVAGRAKVLHFACHGFFDGRTPQDSGLLLSTARPPGLDDVLSVRDLAAWELRSDLVTLSACETGLGQVVPADFLGLARGFAGAGAGAVIASLWPVDDAATQRLMILLYEEVERQRHANGHVDAAGALRTAQLACAAGPLLDWAAFKLIGWPEFDWEASR